MLKAFCVSILFLAMAYAALAQPASSEDGVFPVGPYAMMFSATQGEAGERYHRQIPAFGPTQLNVEFVGAADAAPAVEFKALDVEVQLLWGKNELLPPRLLETHRLSGDKAFSFEHAFDEDGKYIIAVSAKEPGGAAHRGQYIFFVIQTADPHWAISGLAVAFMSAFVYLLWRHRRRPQTRRSLRL